MYIYVHYALQIVKWEYIHNSMCICVHMFMYRVTSYAYVYMYIHRCIKMYILQSIATYSYICTKYICTYIIHCHTYTYIIITYVSHVYTTCCVPIHVL